MEVSGRISVSVLVAFLTVSLCCGEAWGVFDKAGAVVHHAKGLIYNEKGQWDKAIAEYNKAIELNPEYADAYNNRGLAYLDLAQFDHGCQDLQKACELGLCKGLVWARRQVLCQ